MKFLKNENSPFISFQKKRFLSFNIFKKIIFDIGIFNY